jgi:hypothetical protein
MVLGLSFLLGQHQRSLWVDNLPHHKEEFFKVDLPISINVSLFDALRDLFPCDIVFEIFSREQLSQLLGVYLT